MLKLSVIICSHNPRPDYLRRTLDSLQSQSLPKDQWELLLIDNSSREPLAPAWDLSWHPNGRHIHEEQLGLTPARLRGIKEFQSEILVFVDDDNVLQFDYLERALALAAEHSKLGCFGAGILEPEFELEPAVELRPYTFTTACLALCSLSSDRWSNSVTEAEGLLPMGAGLVVRRQVATRYLDLVQDCPIRIQLDRKGLTLVSGGDLEFSWVACELGMGKGLFPSLKITHLIDKKRVEKNYLLSIAQGHAFSDVLLAHVHGGPIHVPSRPSTWFDILGNILCFKKSAALDHARMLWRARNQSEIDKEFSEAYRIGAEKARDYLAERAAVK